MATNWSCTYLPGLAPLQVDHDHHDHHDDDDYDDDDGGYVFGGEKKAKRRVKNGKGN